jgi:hypothetical protein
MSPRPAGGRRARLHRRSTGEPHSHGGRQNVRKRAYTAGLCRVRQVIQPQQRDQANALAGLGQRNSAPPASGTTISRRRSQRYVETIRKLDAGTAERADVSALVEEVLAEFGPGAGLPLGVLARCYLGVPFEVHSLDLGGGIVEHYKMGEPLPEPFGRARRLATHDSYVAIEIYPDRLVCLHEDGRAVEIQG